MTLTEYWTASIEVHHISALALLSPGFVERSRHAEQSLNTLQDKSQEYNWPLIALFDVNSLPVSRS